MKKFQPSINVVYDTGKSELFDMFVPNNDQLEIMENIISSLSKKSLVNSHLMIGPYGAGKSMVGAITASLITARKNSKNVKSFLYNVSGLNNDLSDKIRNNLYENSIKWIPITITGKNGRVDEIILEAIQLKLKSEGIVLSLKGDSEQILQTIELWKNDYKDTYLKLVNLCTSFGCTIEELIQGITINDERFIVEFKKMYGTLTSGATYISESKASFVEKIQHLTNQLSIKKMGLFIIYDEFGRFLQGVNQSLIFQTMQDLQDIAEFANRSSNLGLLFITHTGLRQYSTESNNLSKEELERVEKRFESHRLDSDPSLFYRTAFKILEIVKEDNEPNLFLLNDIEKIKNDLKKYSLFPDMEVSEVENFILEKCQPIHPLTLRLLPILSNMLGQNDRTLYTFLSQFDEASLETDWYYADQLFNYFYPDESSFYLIDDLKYYRLSMSYQISNEAKRLVKLMTLLNISNKPFKLSVDFLSFSLGSNEMKIRESIEELKKIKIIRYNPLASSYELYSGSILSLEFLIEEYRSKTVINDGTRIKFLNDFLPNKYFLPHEYNSVKSMTRFVESQFAWGNVLNLDTPIGDGMILYMIYKNDQELKNIQDFAINPERKDILVCITKLNTKDLIIKLDEFMILDLLLNTSELMQQDENLEAEILIHLENIRFEIEKLLRPIRHFEKDNLTWYINNDVVKIDSKNSLEKKISNWMFERFPATPEIRNEGFNKKNVTSIQKKAAKSILSQLLSPTFSGRFDIQGFGPDYLIYATMFKNTGIDTNNLSQIADDNLLKLRYDLLSYLKQNRRGKIVGLYDLLRHEPYGIREPLIPLLLIALLKDAWHQMAFYSNDFYIHELNADMLYEILELRADFYEYELYELSSANLNLLKDLNTTFFDGTLSEQPVIIFTELTRWLRNLPRYTQVTDQLTNAENQFKEIIRHSETDPLASVTNLAKIIEDSRDLKILKSGLENHLSLLKEQIKEEVLLKMEIESNEDIHKWADSNKELVLNSSILAGFVSEYAQNKDWLAYLIEKIVGVALKDWSDVTYDSFWMNFKQLLMTNQNQDGLIKIVTDNQTIMEIKEVELSVKGKTIYNNVSRIVNAGSRTMSDDEIRFVVYKILSELES